MFGSVEREAERAENEFRKATVLLNQGRVAEAMDGYRLTLQQDGGHVAARQALVGLLLENRRIDEAQQLLQEGLSLNPDRSAYAVLLARIQVERGQCQAVRHRRRATDGLWRQRRRQPRRCRGDRGARRQRP